MEERIFIDGLTEKSVSIKIQKYVIDDGIEYNVGLPRRCAYMNSARERAEILSSLPEPYITAVMMVWGDTSIIIEE